MKSLSALITGITSNHPGDFYCLNCLDSYSTEKKLKKHESVCNDNDYCYVEMHNECNKILKYSHGEMSLKAPAIIYADLESFLEKMHSCQNNPEKSYTDKKTKYMPSAYSLFTNCSCDSVKNNLDCYKSEDCVESSCKDLKEHAMKIINYEKNEMIKLTYEENKYYEIQTVCYICKKEFSDDDDDDDKNYQKVRDNCHYTGKYRGAAHNICNLRYKTTKEISVVFHNSSTYDYHFDYHYDYLRGQLKCLGKIQRNILLFQYRLKKNLIMVKQLHTN